MVPSAISASRDDISIRPHCDSVGMLAVVSGPGLSGVVVVPLSLSGLPSPGTETVAELTSGRAPL